MADAAVSVLVEPLISMIEQSLREEIYLVKGVKKELQNVSSKLQQIRNVLDDAEKRSIQDATVQDWLEKLKDISYDMDDVLDEWNTEISKPKSEEEAAEKQISCSSSLFTACSSPFKQVGLRRDIALKIKDINARLASVIREINGFKFILNYPLPNRSVESLDLKPLTTSIINLSETYGRESDKTTLLSKLLSKGSQQVNHQVPIISIVGVGGLGKTTLAKLLYNNDGVMERFSKRIWVCVSNPFDKPRIAREIAIAIGTNPPSDCSLDTLLTTHLKESISDHKFLLVLDDVWDEEGKKWEDLRNCLDHGAVGSRILLTTRKETVAKVMGTSGTNLHHLGKLSEEACWSLFSQIAFGNEKKDNEINLTKIGREIVQKCKGLPLAVRTLANLLSSKKTEEEWELVLHSEIWNLEKAEVELFPQLYLSYIELPPPVKMCFSYCSIFPKDTIIDVDDLIHMWMAQGYITSGDIGECDMELKGREYFDKLAMCCFFQDFEKDGFGRIYKCKMHDIVHDFTQYLRRNECITIANVIPDTFSQKARHLTLLPSPEIESPHLTICDMGKLRTFSAKVHSHDQADALFNHLKCVRVLVLKDCDLKKLPKKVGSFVHLRSLDLSGNWKLDELPESVCELYNLQTLNIVGCRLLTRLPQMIGNLRNLRHLVNFDAPSLEKYPKSFEKLTRLRTLNEFVVEKEFGKLEHLKHFKHLRGSLSITIGDDLEEADFIIDAEKAQLKNKKHIRTLELIISKVEVGTAAVWEALEPPSNVEVLTIWGMFGTQWPSWILKSHFNNLKSLQINDFPNCSILPPLGKLPNLETLSMRWNESIKHIGRGFLGIEEEGITLGLRRAAAPSSSSSLICFPKLVHLEFCGLVKWEEWEDLNQEDDEQGIQIMPRLRYLRLYSCPKLKQLPDALFRKASCLEELRIYQCDTERSRRLFEQVLSHIPQIVVNGRLLHSR